MPDVLTNRMLPIVSSEPLWRNVLLANIALAYFGAYWAFAARWDRLKPHLKSEFVGAILLWGLNVLVLFPLIGRGIFGYKLPQGAFLPCLYLLGMHWLYARMLQLSSSRQAEING